MDFTLLLLLSNIFMAFFIYLVVRLIWQESRARIGTTRWLPAIMHRNKKRIQQTMMAKMAHA